MGEKQNIKEAKRNIRKQILAIRNEIPLKLREEKSNQILQTLYGLECYKEADVILAYADYQSEVITTPLFIKALLEEKQVFAPKVSGEDMEFFQISDMADMAEGYKGIREPVSETGFMDRISYFRTLGEIPKMLMLMPGAVFDKEHHRIGYGKGFYDRYLKRLMEASINVYKIALCYECQLLNEIPHENHDVRADMIITENGIY